jgi:hypothetical protein
LAGRCLGLEADYLFIPGRNVLSDESLTDLVRRRVEPLSGSRIICWQRLVRAKEDSMVRLALAVAIVVMAFMTVSGVSYAAPGAPLAAGVASEASAGGVTQVYWHRHWHHHWCRWHRC